VYLAGLRLSGWTEGSGSKRSDLSGEISGDFLMFCPVRFLVCAVFSASSCCWRRLIAADWPDLPAISQIRSISAINTKTHRIARIMIVAFILLLLFTKMFFDYNLLALKRQRTIISFDRSCFFNNLKNFAIKGCFSFVCAFSNLAIFRKVERSKKCLKNL
jgi:hypothetical protein